MTQPPDRLQDPRLSHVGPEPGLDPASLGALEAVLDATGGLSGGVVMTDLDGTAVIERDGRIVVPEEVALPLRRLNDLGCPVALNTLRFPLNVIRTFGRAWRSISDSPLPLVSLNGSLVGVLTGDDDETRGFEELQATPLPAGDIEEVLAGVEGLVGEGVDDIALFRYPRDWRQGEIIWTPSPARVPALGARYLSASRVEASTVAILREALHAAPVLMLMLVADAGRSRLMAYQRARRSDFVTAEGVDKRSGALGAGRIFGFDLARGVAAGDTPVDAFLGAAALAVQVGPRDLEHRGRLATVKAPDVPGFGAVLSALADRLGPNRR